MNNVFRTRYSNYNIIYRNFINKLRETFPYVNLKKNIYKYSLVNSDITIKDAKYFNVVAFAEAANVVNNQLTITLPQIETDVTNNSLYPNGRILIVSNFTQDIKVLVKDENDNMILDVNRFDHLLNPFYVLIYSNGKWQNISIKQTYMHHFSDAMACTPVFNQDIQINFYNEIDFEKIAPVPQVAARHLFAQKYIKMSDLTFDPENYELDSTEGFLYVNNGALKFKSSNNSVINLTFMAPPAGNNPYITPRSHYKLEDDFNSLQVTTIYDLLKKQNIFLEKPISIFEDGISGKCPLVDGSNQIHLFSNTCIEKDHTWSFWLKPETNTYEDHNPASSSSIFSFGNEQNYYAIFTDSQGRLLLKAKYNDQFIPMINNPADNKDINPLGNLNDTISKNGEYKYDTSKYHHIAIVYSDNSGANSMGTLNVFINGEDCGTVVNMNLSGLANKLTKKEFSYLGKQLSHFVDEIKYFPFAATAAQMKVEFGRYPAQE